MTKPTGDRAGSYNYSDAMGHHIDDATRAIVLKVLDVNPGLSCAMTHVEIAKILKARAYEVDGIDPADIRVLDKSGCEIAEDDIRLN